MFCLKKTSPSTGMRLKPGTGTSGSVGIRGGVRVTPIASRYSSVDSARPMKNRARPMTNWSIFNVVVK
jgi:hypothetical protein